MSTAFRRFAHICFAAFFLAATSAANATWHEVSSDHFVIYADASEEDIRTYAEKLETFHSALEQATGRTLEKPSPSNRITIYAVGSESAIRRLAGTTGIGGFYLPNWRGSAAFVQSVNDSGGRSDVSKRIILHEYVHHFFARLDRNPMPLWMNEGAAEFFSAAHFLEDGSVYMGLYPSHRSFSALWMEEYRTRVPEVLLLDWERLSIRSPKDKDSFYSNSWLLYHYLSTNEERQGQLREYWLEVLQGADSLDAARKVFGNLGNLQRQINAHARDRDRGHVHITADRLTAGEVTIRALNDAEEAAMEAAIQLARGVAPETARELAGDLSSIAAEFPDETFVLTLLAKAEYAAGNDMATIAAADAALALDASLIDAYVYKGQAQFRSARSITDPQAKSDAYAQAMEPLERLKAIEPDHPVPLVYTYRSFAERGVLPSDNAKAALMRAAQLAPTDEELWLITGMMHMNDGRIADARQAFAPLAASPHGGEKAQQVRSMLAFLSDKPEGQAIPVQAAISAYFIEE